MLHIHVDDNVFRMYEWNLLVTEIQNRYLDP